jgi:L-ascorbate metabolism protein UlaG (beta-lactamase superfamily)
MKDLPCNINELDHPDLTLVTHTHFDHLDREAASSNIRHCPAVCQVTDVSKLRAFDFESIIPIGKESLTFKGLSIFQTSGSHGHWFLSKMMGKVTGYVIKSGSHPCVYIAGDTIWNESVATTIKKHNPDIIVVNCGAARFNIGAPITMSTGDIVRIRESSPKSTIVAVHMEAINHCRLDRRVLRANLEKAGISQRILIPADGEELVF